MFEVLVKPARIYLLVIKKILSWLNPGLNQFKLPSFKGKDVYYYHNLKWAAWVSKNVCILG